MYLVFVALFTHTVSLLLSSPVNIRRHFTPVVHLPWPSKLGQWQQGHRVLGFMSDYWVPSAKWCRNNTTPLTWFSPRAEAVYRGVALGATCERYRDEWGPVVPVHSTRQGAACQTTKGTTPPQSPQVPIHIVHAPTHKTHAHTKSYHDCVPPVFLTALLRSVHLKALCIPREGLQGNRK